MSDKEDASGPKREFFQDSLTLSHIEQGLQKSLTLAHINQELGNTQVEGQIDIVIAQVQVADDPAPVQTTETDSFESEK